MRISNHMENEELFSFAPEVQKPYTDNSQTYKWNVLIVDDEEDVHNTTILALRNVTVRSGPKNLHKPLGGNSASPDPFKRK